MIIEDCYSLSIKDLRLAGLLSPWSMGKRVIFTYRDGLKINVDGFLYDDNPFIVVSIPDLFMQQEIRLKKMKSNISGFYYYFVCTRSGSKCLKLFLPKDSISFESKLNSMRYYQQTKSKKRRSISLIVAHENKRDMILTKLLKKYAKWYYNGKQTKNMKMLNSIHQKLQNLGYHPNL